MPGERKGKIYELVVGESLRQAFPTYDLASQIRLPGSLIDSDWLLSEDGRPQILALVTHSTSETKNTQKFWRDIAEVLQAIVATNGNIRTIGFIFDNRVLKQLISAERAILDVFISAEQLPGCHDLLAFKEEAFDRLDLRNVRRLEDAEPQFRAALYRAVKRAVEAIACELGHVGIRASKHTDIWKLMIPADISGNGSPTYCYKGCANLMLVEPERRKDLLACGARGTLPRTGLPPYYQYFTGGKTITGMRPAPDLVWVAQNMNHDLLLHALGRAESAKARVYRNMLGFYAYLPCFVERLRAISRPAIFGLLNEGFRAPTTVADKMLGCEVRPILFHWPWTFLVTLTREVLGKKQGFGASRIGAITGNRRLVVQNSLITGFECLERDLLPEDKQRLAGYFEEQILPELAAVNAESLQQRYLHEVYVDKLGPHAVHPLPALIKEIAQRSRTQVEYVWRDTSFSVASGCTGNAGRVRVLSDGLNLLWWRSAQEGHEADKAKEVGARVFGLTTTVEGMQLIRSSKPGKFILVLDGEFDPSHEKLFYSMGVDSILRPHDLEPELPRVAGW